MGDSARAGPALTSSLPTERLLLRSVRAGDDLMLTRIWTDPDVRRYMGGPLTPELVRQRNHDFVGKPGKYCVTLRETGEPIGLLGLGPDRRSGQIEVSYGFLPEHWGRGYAREALRALLAWVFDRLPGTDVIVANTRSDNEPSRKLLRSVGAHFVEHFGEHEESAMYTIPRRQNLTSC